MIAVNWMWLRSAALLVVLLILVPWSGTGQAKESPYRTLSIRLNSYEELLPASVIIQVAQGKYPCDARVEPEAAASPSGVAAGASAKTLEIEVVFDSVITPVVDTCTRVGDLVRLKYVAREAPLTITISTRQTPYYWDGSAAIWSREVGAQALMLSVVSRRVQRELGISTSSCSKGKPIGQQEFEVDRNWGLLGEQKIQGCPEEPDALVVAVQKGADLRAKGPIAFDVKQVKFMWQPDCS